MSDLRHHRGSLVAALLIGLLVLPGCATRPVRLTSEPPGARVQIDDMKLTTPCDVTLEPGTHVARFSLDSHPERAVERSVHVPGTMKVYACRLGQGSGQVLRGVALPFLCIGSVGACLLSASAESGGMSYSSEEEACVALVLLAGTAGGYAVGLPLYWAGEWLDDVSHLSSPNVAVTLRAASDAKN